VAAGSNPPSLTNIQCRLFFAANDGTFGVELWGVHPTAVEQVLVNEGSAQRSMVQSLTVVFSGLVTAQDGAFELLRHGVGPVGLSVALSVLDGRTVALLTFVGDEVVAGSLADGNYTLTIHGDLLRDTLGRRLDPDGDGAEGGDRTDGFFRYFGDADGDRDVDDQDEQLFQST